MALVRGFQYENFDLNDKIQKSIALQEDNNNLRNEFDCLKKHADGIWFFCIRLISLETKAHHESIISALNESERALKNRLVAFYHEADQAMEQKNSEISKLQQGLWEKSSESNELRALFSHEIASSKSITSAAVYNLEVCESKLKEA